MIGKLSKICSRISDIDRRYGRIIGNSSGFFLGKWIKEAACGFTPAEKDLYEQNARDLITLWGDANSPLHEYSNRQWNGLMKDFTKFVGKNSLMP
jgi:alpha-N-acetylglucosaminidase